MAGGCVSLNCFVNLNNSPESRAIHLHFQQTFYLLPPSPLRPLVCRWTTCFICHFEMGTINVAPFVLCRLLVGLRYVAQKLLTEVDGWGSSKNRNPFPASSRSLHAHPPTQPHVLSAKEWLLFKLMKVSSSHQQRHHRERLPGSRIIIIIIATGILRGSTLEWNMALIPVIIASWLTVWPFSSNPDES